MKTPRFGYYGPLFWLSVVSFVVPLIVAARAFDTVRLASRPTPQPDASGIDHRIWDFLLKKYVDNGLVDYDGIGSDYLFKEYIREIAQACPCRMESDDAKLAFYCNAYNALVIDGVVRHGIRDSVMQFKREGRGFFDQREHIVAGHTLSLNELEHEVIRKRFRDPRVHMALVCAARSCPPLRREAYCGDRLQQQLEDQARLFCNDPKFVDHDEVLNTVRLSPIVKWYAEDWARYGGYLKWIGERVDDSCLREALQRAIDRRAVVEFNDYDWRLNSQSRPGASSASQPKPDFGSGSIPID